MEVHEWIGPYEILRELGRGGMGVVYLAREPDEGSLIALKVLPETYTDDASRLERFRREAATVMKVRHPNIIPIYSVGCSGGTWFIAMKYIEGVSLDRLIRDRETTKTSAPSDRTVIMSKPPVAASGALHGDETSAPLEDGESTGASDPGLATKRHRTGSVGSAPDPKVGPPISWISKQPIRPSDPLISSVSADVGATTGAEPLRCSSEPAWVYRAVMIVETIARALDHVHSRGLVHRDVKPGNIIIDGQGEAWLADFGLVRDLDREARPQTEGVLGTVQYMAPEQISADQRRTDGRSDLYALGVTLYELATLTRPFDGADTREIVRAVRRQKAIPPRKINPRVSRGFQRVIRKAMAKDPDDRYQTGHELADDLEKLRMLRSDEPKPRFSWDSLRRVGGKNRGLKAAAAVLFLAVIALAGVCVEGAFRERHQLIECRLEADRAFDRGDYRSAATGYKLCLKLGGDSSGVMQRLKVCDEVFGSGESEGK